MSKENIKVDNIAIIRDYKLDYEDYLNELKSKLQNQKCHIECEMIWKLSKMGISSHRRVIHIFDKYLFYYTKFPTNFTTNDFELLRNITPKAGFKYTELNQNFSLKNDIKKKTKFLILEFPSDKIISFKKGHGNPLFDITKIDLIGNLPLKANERKKTLKWILSTNPAQTLDNLKKLYPQEVFLNKLIQIIQKEDFASEENHKENKTVSPQNLQEPIINNIEDNNAQENKSFLSKVNESSSESNTIKSEEIKEQSGDKIKLIKTEENSIPSIKETEIHKEILFLDQNLKNPTIITTIHHTKSNENLSENEKLDGKLKEKSLQDINESYHSDIPFQNTVNIVYEINSNDKLKLNVKLEKKNSGFSILKDQETNYQSSFDCVEDISHFPKTKSSFDQDYNEKMNKKTSPHKGSYEIMNSNERNTLNSPKKNEQTLNSTNKTTLNAPKRNALHFSKTVHLEYSFLNNDFKDLNDNLKAQSIRSKILQNSLRQNDKIQDSMFFDESIEKKVETNEENNFPENLNFGLKRYIFEETIDDLKQNLENIEEKTKKNNNKCEQLEDIQSFEKQQNNPLEYTTQINWEYLFYQTIKETLAEQLDYNKMMTSGLHLIEIIKEFQGFCKNIMKNIVTEFVLPKEKRKYLPIIEKPDILIYNLKEEKVIIKLVGLKEKKFENFISNFKALGNEYRANIFVLNRILSNMKENSKDTHFKVPLCCLIDYFGFRCLIYCKPNGIDGDKTLALGFDSKNNYQKNILLDDKIITSLSNILTIKKHFIRVSYPNKIVKEFETSLVSSVEIHQTESNYRRKIERDSIKIYEFHLLNPTHVLPDFFYANNNFNHSRLEKYRPEFIEEYLQAAHNPEWLISEPLKNEYDEASLSYFKIYEQNIDNFVDLLENKINIFSDNNNQSQENSDIMSLENKTLSELLHKKGINLKILARLFTTFSLPFLKMMALNEMIVKICKNLIRFDISKIFFEDYLSNILNCQKKIKQNIVDFLNLLYYPKKPKSKIFWKEVIWHQLELRYDINIPVAIKNDYQIPLNYLKQLLDSLGIEYTTSSNSNFKLMQVEDFRDMCFNLKAKPLELLSIDAFKLFNSPIIMENEYFQKQIYQIMGLDNEFHLKKMLYYQKNGDFKNIIENYSNLYYSIGNLKELKIIFNSYLALKDPHNALKILDKISEYTSLDYPKCHPYFLLNLWRLCEFYLKEGFEEETLFLTRKILNKFEKCLNLRGCFSWGVYDKILENFNAFNCNKEKMLCLEKICKFEKENLKSFTDLINIYISKGEKSKAIRIFDNLLKIIKKKREKFSKDNFNNLLELNSIFSNIEEENLSIECLRIIWLGLNNMNVSLNDFPIVFSNYLSRVFIITMQGFSKEKKKILKDILGFLKKKQKTIEEKIQLIIKNTKKLNYDEFLEYFKEILSRIISKQKIDSKNIDEEIIEGILLIVKEAL